MLQQTGHHAGLFHFVMVKPTHYDDDGYPIQWLRSAIPSNTLACLNGLAEDAQRRQVLGPDVDAAAAHLRRDQPARPARSHHPHDPRRPAARRWSALVGVQSNQFPRAVDLARPFLAAGLPVVHRRLSRLRLPRHAARTAGRPARGAGDSAFRCSPARPRAAARPGAARRLGRARCARSTTSWTTCRGWRASRRRCCRPRMSAAPRASLSSFDLGRGCPYQCSFCTIINVQGRKSRYPLARRRRARSCARTTRRASSASSSPTTTSPATGTGRRCSTG